MVRWTKAIVLLTCLQATVFAQTGDQSNLGQASAKEDRPTGTGQAAPPQSTSIDPLDLFQNFSAVMIGSRAEPGEGTSQGRIYRYGSLMRMEEPGGHAYFITDLNTGETYGILEGGCIRDDHPYIRAIPFHMTGKSKATVTRVPTGKEVVGGHPCVVEDITFSSSLFPEPQKMRFWEAEDLRRFPVKIEFVLPGGHDPIIRYKNVLLGPQDSALFIHPKSCQALPQESPADAAHKPSAQ